MIQDRVKKVLLQLHSRLANHHGKWLVGGSTSLLMQGVSLTAEPNDLDVYTDDLEIMALHQCLQDYAIDEPAFSKTSIYRSTLSHYHLNKMEVELVGSFQVETGNSHYEVKVNTLLPYATEAFIQNRCILLMPLAHELIFNVLRNRADRYKSIAMLMRKIPSSLNAFESLLQANQISAKHEQFMKQLVK